MNYAPFEAEVPKVNDLLCAGSSAGAPIFIRTVALRDTFAKTARRKELEGRLSAPSPPIDGAVGSQPVSIAI